MISRMIENWWYIQKRKDGIDRKLRKITWDNIPVPQNTKEWHKCFSCGEIFPYILHPDPDKGYIAHFKTCGRKK